MVIGTMLRAICMDNQPSYLNNQIPKLITNKISINHYWQYNVIKLKRLLIHTVLIFIFQFLIIVNLTFQYPALPMYPPIGVAFVMFYLFGANAFLGLILSEICGCFFHGLPMNTIFLYLIADLLGAWVGAIWCKNIFFSDVNHLINKKILLAFVAKNAAITCFISSFIKILAIILINQTTYGVKILLYNYINLWLADLNAILIIPSCILSWVAILFNQQNIYYKNIKILSIITILFILLSMLFMQQLELIYLIIIATITAIYAAYYYGYPIATLLLFVISSIYLCYFIAFKYQYLLYLGNLLYISIPMVLLLFALGMLYLSLVLAKK